MPELPEVETIRQGLRRLILDQKIQAVAVGWPKIIQRPSVDEFIHELIGEHFREVRRRGKYLIFELDHYELVSHLRMEGKYLYEAHDAPKNKYVHVTFALDSGNDLRYQDLRKFGRMSLVKKGEALHLPELEKLGPEPTPETFDFDVFYHALAHHHQMIKPLLLGQRIVAGIGNIYADEVLWLAKIHPMFPAERLTKAEAVALHAAILEVIHDAVEAGGTTIRSYQNALGEAGKFQLELRAYGQTGKPCLRCGTPIEKIIVAQRGTHLCPHCQKLPRLLQRKGRGR